jgi:hypothetical protein
LRAGERAVLALAVGWEWSLRMLWREAIGRVGASRVCLDDFAESVLVAKQGFFLAFNHLFSFADL